MFTANATKSGMKTNPGAINSVFVTTGKLIARLKLFWTEKRT
jgi:hypothetical protein